MKMPTSYRVVLVTASSEEEARRLARDLLEKKLIACANLVPIQSLYWWEGAIEEAAEVLMILKTTQAALQDELIEAVQAAHSYDVPEVIGLPVVAGAADYLRWIGDNVQVSPPPDEKA